MSKTIWKPTTLLGPLPPTLVSCGTVEHPNVLTIAWTGIVNTHPAMTYISVRPSRFSYELIKKSGEFVINLPSSNLAKAVDFCGVRSGKNTDKFHLMGFHASPCQQISAPLIEECPVNLECKVTQVLSLGSHDMFLAEILAVHVQDDLIDDSGKLHLDQANLLAFAHGEYYELGHQKGTFGFSVRKKPKNNRAKRSSGKKTPPQKRRKNS